MTKEYEVQDEITIDLEVDVYDMLSKMAEADRRTRKQEANFIIIEEARKRGLISTKEGEQMAQRAQLRKKASAEGRSKG